MDAARLFNRSSIDNKISTQRNSIDDQEGNEGVDEDGKIIEQSTKINKKLDLLSRLMGKSRESLEI